MMCWTDWTPLDSTGLHWTVTGLLVHWTGTGLSKVACSPVGVQWTRLDWTGLESSGLSIAPANLAWQEGHWNPLESTGVHMDYVGEGKDLPMKAQRRG
jgi:hypothetical protein